MKNKEIKGHFAKMQFIEEGRFTIGLTSDFDVRAEDSTLFASIIPKRVEVNSFYISATEVTNLEWREFYNDKVDEFGAIKAKNEFYATEIEEQS